MTIMKKSSTALLLIASLAFAGCASQTGSTFSSSQARTAQTVQMGTITALNNATIQDNASGLGAGAGAIAGGVAGSTIGGGRGRVLGVLGGAAVGAAAGHAIENRVRTTDGIEITVKLDDGTTLSVVQERGEEERGMRVGDRIRLLRGSDGSARVRR